MILRRRRSAAATLRDALRWLWILLWLVALAAQGFTPFRQGMMSSYADKMKKPPPTPILGVSCSSLSKKVANKSSSFSFLATEEPQRCCCYHRSPSLIKTTTSSLHILFASSSGNDDDDDDNDDDDDHNYDDDDDPLFDGATSLRLVATQSLLVLAAISVGSILQTPNLGFGPNISFAREALQQGAVYSLPLFGLALVLDSVEEYCPPLREVTLATQRSVIALLGGTFKPFLALVVSVTLGTAAGVGEEVLFRGVLQYELATRWFSLPESSSPAAAAIWLSSVVFGILHAVTPLYALLATLASAFFGYLYESTDNLAIPIACHAVYDVGALLWAHWTVAQMTEREREEVVYWKSPLER